MKKKWKIIFFIIIIVILLLFGLNYILNGVNIDGKENLIANIEQYLANLEEPHYFLEDKNSVPNYDINDFKVFTQIENFGVKQKFDKTYVYVYALVESYYVQNNKLVLNSGLSCPLTFIFKNDEIIDCLRPKDGEGYAQSIRNMFPLDIMAKYLSFEDEKMSVKNQVEDYYSEYYQL